MINRYQASNPAVFRSIGCQPTFMGPMRLAAPKAGQFMRTAGEHKRSGALKGVADRTRIQLAAAITPFAASWESAGAAQSP